MTLTSMYLEHIARLQSGYERALETTEFDAVVLHSGRGLRRLSVDDQYWPNRITPSFAHWLPIKEPGVLIVIQTGKRPQLIKAQINNFWEGSSAVESDHFWSSFELIECETEAIGSQLPSGKLAWIGDDTQSADTYGIPLSSQNPPELLAELEALRVIKSSYEVACLKTASEIATRGHAHLIELFSDGHHSELSLHLAYLLETGQDATDTPYSNIVAQGENAAILHHVLYNRHVDTSENQSMLVDAGAESMGYASDITRTSIRGQSQAARDFRALVDAMTSLELSLCKQIKPGLAYEELHNQSHHLLANVLIDIGICKGSSEDVVDRGVSRAFFPHGLGHSLGLQVHDVSCRLTPPASKNPFLRNTSTIKEGQVFTIEPGCYFIDGLLGPLKNSQAGELVSWSTVETLRAFGGIRIEDNVLVTASSSINLTRDNWPNSTTTQEQ